MKRFIKLSFFYFFAFVSILIAVLYSFSEIVKNRSFEQHETESNLLVMKEDTKYDVLFVGISHARNFSRHNNHQRVEGLLGEKIFNIGQGGGACGVNEQLFYLDYFYHKGNSVRKVVYILSPPLMYSNDLPIASNTFDLEPFDFHFLSRYMFFETENKGERVINYLQSKVSKKWLSHTPYSLDEKVEELDSLDYNIVKEGQKSAYNDSLKKVRFVKSSKRIEETIELAINNGSEVLLIIPPALFGKWNSHENVLEYAKKMAVKNTVKYLDLSESVLKPKYYYDHHHLNSKGIDYFVSVFLMNE